MPPDPDTKTTSSPLHRLLSGATFVVFAALLTVALGEREFWTDEIVTTRHITEFRTTYDAFHPRGYYALLYGWKLLFGDSDLVLRAFSVPWALLALALVWAIGRRLLKPREQLLAQWLFTLSPFIVLYFRMARFYSMVTAVFLLAAYCAVLVAQEGKGRQWLALGLSAAALLQTSYVASILLGPLFVAMIVIAIRRRQAWGCVAGLLPGLLVLAHHVQVLLNSMQRVAGVEHGPAAASVLKVLLRLALPFYSVSVGETTDPWRLYITVPALAGAMAAIALGSLAKNRRPGYALIRWAWPLTVLFVALVLTTVAKGEPLSAAARSCIFGAPLAYILMAVGICRVRRRAARAVMLAVILVAQGYGLLNYFAKRQFLNPNYVMPWREVVRIIEEERRPGDLVLGAYDLAILRYATFDRFLNVGKVGIPPDKLRPITDWPNSGCRMWLVTRDRGAAKARSFQKELIARLKPGAETTEVVRLLRYSPIDRRFRSAFLQRPVEESYVAVYLFTPPGWSEGD